MDHSFESQPRDSRLEKFSVAAANIISIERGLTATALSKIHIMATEQHLSKNQVNECLERIGDGSSSLGRVGRYEQIFLDRLDADLSSYTGTVLSPQKAHESIRLATVEYQISTPRAHQLLDHGARKRGLQQISAADARNRMRVLITQRLESFHQRTDFEGELISHGVNFGITADEVRALLDTETETRNRLRGRRKNQLIAVIGTTLIAVSLTVAGFWFWPKTQTTALLDQTTTDPIVALNTTAATNVRTEPIAEAPNGSQNSVTQPQKDLSISATEASNFEIDDFLTAANTGPVLRFGKWQEQFVELVSQDFQQSPPEIRPTPFADRQKKTDALDALKSERSNERMQARALDDLSAAAQRIDDITPEEAQSIAAFCFGKHSAPIEVAIVRTVKQFGRWPNFLLAVSDAFADQERQSVTSNWNQRLAFAITDGKLKNNDNFSESFFAVARLRIQEILNQYEQANAKRKMNVESNFVRHLREFISDNITDRHHQCYFNRLIDARDLTKPSMQRQIELQQILIEALLFAKPDDASLADGETHFNRLNSATTLGEQLTLSRRSAVVLVTRHHQWLKQFATSPLILEQRPTAKRSVPHARLLRDEAENIAMSRNRAQIENAVAKYEAAMNCDDNATIRSCLRGLIAIAQNQADRNRYYRQLDFVNGGQLGPFSQFAGDIGDSNSTQTNWSAIVNKCRQLRRSSGTSLEKSAKPEMAKPSPTWATLNWLAKRQPSRSLFELDLLLQIEAQASLMIASSKASIKPIQLPGSVQATLPAVEVTPLVPLKR